MKPQTNQGIIPRSEQSIFSAVDFIWHKTETGIFVFHEFLGVNPTQYSNSLQFLS